jgi:uncharacterized protein
VPVTLLCEEAHRYVPSNTSLGFAPASAPSPRSPRRPHVWRLAVHRHPAAGRDRPDHPVDCNTIFALRMSNDRDQQIVNSAISDTGAGRIEFLPARGQREPIGVGAV